jgi:hypothetical protein
MVNIFLFHDQNLLKNRCLFPLYILKREIIIEGKNYSTFILSLYCPDQSAENESNQYSFIFDVFLINSAYTLLQVLIYSYHEFIYNVNRLEG